MPKKNISEDSFSMWNIDGNSKTWTLKEDATITVNDNPAVNVLATSVGNTLRLLGDIVASGDDGQGVLVSGADTRILIGKQSEIDADEGIAATASGLRVTNKGEIDGLHYGISNSASSTIRNLGDISADVGISTLGTSKVINGADGMIQGDFAGVIMTVGNGSALINHGMISGNDFAVRMLTGGENRLVNTGTIHGDILFGTGDDLLDSNKGLIKGTVTGGDGNDTYKIGKNDISIVEAADNGIDTVFSRTTHYLNENVENLHLAGKGNIIGQGNQENNVLVGNKGNNVMRGNEGDDEIGGGAGDDRLIGDDGADVFIFRFGDDSDEISDFIKGEDTVSLVGFDGVSSFADIQSRMSQEGNDVWLDLGKGDRLMFENRDIADFDASDFNFVA